MLGLPGSAPSAPREAPKADTSAQTSNASADAPKPGSAASADALKKPIPQKTMMGMTSPFLAGPPLPLNPGKQGDRASKPPPPSTTPLASPAASPTRAAPSPSAPEGELSPKRTMLGVAPPPSVVQAIREANAQAKREADEAALAEPAEAAAPPASSRAASTAAPAAAPGEPPAAPGIAAPAAAPARKIAAKSDRTMLGIATATPSAPSDDAARPSIPGNQGLAFTEPEEPLEEPAAAPSGSALRRIAAALAGALIVLAAFSAVWFATRAPEIRLRVSQSEEGEQLEVELPAAEPGTKVRFLGAEQELQGGVAKFALAADSLALGDNELTIGVLRGGEVESTSVHLNVAYRARVELAGLSRDPPALDVIIEALPGSKALLDGAPLTLDARGHGVKSYPIAPQSGSKLAFSARYRIEPKEGTAAEGTLALNLPVTSLQIDRPGPTVTTDQAALEVAGAVEAGAEVLVDGQAVRVNEGRFLHRLRLQKPGEYQVRVLARGQGKAPRAFDLKITRVADLALAAASFKPDPALTYARIAQNPVIYRGQNVAFDGRVYNVEVKGGASHLQMLVRDCPGTQRCPLWVELPQATDATTDSWVRVLGTVAGEQQFRSERGQVHTVPSVKAQYVLKLAR